MQRVLNGRAGVVGGVCKAHADAMLVLLEAYAALAGVDMLRTESAQRNRARDADAPQAQGLFALAIPHLASAASSLTRASTQRAPSGVASFFQNGACVLR